MPARRRAAACKKRAPHSCGTPLYYILEAMAACAYSTDQALPCATGDAHGQYSVALRTLTLEVEEDPTFPLPHSQESEDSGSEGMIKYFCPVAITRLYTE